MNDGSNAPKWEEPQLLVFTRNHSEEAVLTACKNGIGFVSGDQYWLYASCYHYTAACNLAICSAIAST